MRHVVYFILLAGVLCAGSTNAAWLPPGGPVVPGEYIVRAAEGQGSDKLRSIAAYQTFGLRVEQTLDFKNEAPAVVVRVNDDIARFMAATGFDVTPEWEVRTTGTFTPTARVAQTDAPWNLDRIDQRVLPLDRSYAYTFTGRLAGVIVLDTSVLQNPDFADRLMPDGKDFVGDGKGLYDDCGGYGTHATGVVSVLAGSRYGVAKEVSVVLGRVLGCGNVGKGSAVQAGLDWALSYAKAHPERFWVVNMSFGQKGSSVGYDPYLRKLNAAGVLVVAGAGNDNIDASQFAPANSPYVIAVGGTTSSDRRSTQSNYGKKIVAYAPGEGVRQNSGIDPNEEWTGTGTSLAAPQVAGVLALLHEQFPGATGAQLLALLSANATKDLINNTKTAPGSLLYAGPFQEIFSSLAARWSERRLTVSLKAGLSGGGVPPAERVRLFRGPATNGRCQGRPAVEVPLEAGAVSISVRGWKQPPAFVCVETSFGGVADTAVAR
jgi:subtilisin family serine protease